MEALVLEIRNLDELTCTRTSAKSNVFVPSNLIYRTAIQGAMVRAKLFSEGRNYAFEYTHLLNALYNAEVAKGKKIEIIGEFYRSLLGELPKVAFSDGVLLQESRIRKEVFNSIYRGTATALGSFKKKSALFLKIPNARFQLRRGKMEGIPDEIATGLYGYYFTQWGESDAKLREIMVSRIDTEGHLFRVPGATWRIGFFGEREELEDALEFFKIVLIDIGIGAKHAFRGKGEILKHEFLPLTTISQSEPQVGELFHPLICTNGKLFETLDEYGLNPKFGFQITQRKSDFFPLGKNVIALDGKFEATRGWSLTYNGVTFLWI